MRWRKAIATRSKVQHPRSQQNRAVSQHRFRQPSPRDVPGCRYFARHLIRPARSRFVLVATSVVGGRESLLVAASPCAVFGSAVVLAVLAPKFNSPSLLCGCSRLGSVIGGAVLPPPSALPVCALARAPLVAARLCGRQPLRGWLCPRSLGAWGDRHSPARQPLGVPGALPAPFLPPIPPAPRLHRRCRPGAGWGPLQPFPRACSFSRTEARSIPVCKRKAVPSRPGSVLFGGWYGACASAEAGKDRAGKAVASESAAYRALPAPLPSFRRSDFSQVNQISAPRCSHFAPVNTPENVNLIQTLPGGTTRSPRRTQQNMSILLRSLGLFIGNP